MLRCFLLACFLALISARPSWGQAIPPAPGPSSPHLESVLTSPVTSSSHNPSVGASEPHADAHRLAQANQQYLRGEFEAAIQSYRSILEQHPQTPEAYAGLTRVCLKQEDVQKAYEVATMGVRLTDGPTAHTALGEVYFRQGKLLGAEQEWLNVINKGEPIARAYWGLSRVRTAQSLNKQAQEMLDKARELDGTDLDIAKSWINSQSGAEQIRFWSHYLASPNNEDAETRVGLQHRLDFLKATQNQPPHSCRLVSPVQATEMKLLPLQGDGHLRGYGLGVSLNGTEGNMLLDTGTHGIVIGRKLAGKAGILKVSETNFVGGGDGSSSGGYQGFAKSITIGGLEYQDCRVEVTDQDSALVEEGVIGMDVFGAFLLDIDFPAQQLSLQPLPQRPSDNTGKLALQTSGEEWKLDDDPASGKADPGPQEKSSPPIAHEPRDRYIAPEMVNYTPIYHFGHLMLIPTKVGDESQNLFVLDTGSSMSPLSLTTAKGIVNFLVPSSVGIRGMSGSVANVFDVGDVTLQIGNLKEENKQAFAFDLSHLSNEVGTEVSGILGINLLRQLAVRIDYRDGLVDFRQKQQ